jgi:tRNA-specific adenosine deaminase 1
MSMYLSLLILTRTGMKCLPRNKLATANGGILHDCHAEILAIRTFNRFLIDECSRLAGDTDAISQVIERRPAHELTESKPQLFTVKVDIKIHMYCSESPCGDASMELVMQAQLDPTPWNRSLDLDRDGDELPGRADFARLGIVRRKPGKMKLFDVQDMNLAKTWKARPDAPQSLSKSCSDKLSIYQCITVLRSITAFLITPENAYIKSVVLPSSQYVTESVDRAFSSMGRMKKAIERSTVWANGYGFSPFRVVTTDLEFEYSKRSQAGHSNPVPSNKCVVWTPSFNEIIINGVLQGRKVADRNAASLISRRQMWSAVDYLTTLPSDAQYSSIKKHQALKERSRVKKEVVDALGSWIANDGDDMFRLS